MFKDGKAKRYLPWALTGFAAISLSILFYFLLNMLDNAGDFFADLKLALRPIIIGMVIAYLLRPMCNRLFSLLNKLFKGKNEKAANILAVALSALVGVLLVYVLMILVVPQVYTSIISLRRTLPRQAEEIMAELRIRLVNYPDAVVAAEESYAKLKSWLDNFITEVVLPNLGDIVDGVTTGFSMALDGLVGVVAAVYLLLARKKYAKGCEKIIRAVFKPRAANRIMKEVIHVDRKFGGYINGKLLDCLIIGVAAYAFNMIAGIPSALLVAVLIGVFNIIPFFGPIIGGVIVILLVLIQSPIKALYLGIFVLILQQIDGNILGPRILGDSTGISGFWVMFSILLFGGLFGVAGMVIGVPLFAVIYDLLRDLIYLGLKRNGLSPDLTPLAKKSEEKEESTEK